VAFVTEEIEMVGIKVTEEVLGEAVVEEGDLTGIATTEDQGHTKHLVSSGSGCFISIFPR